MKLIDSLSYIFENKKDISFWNDFTSLKKGKLKSKSGDLFVEYKYENINFKIGEYTHYITGHSKEYYFKYGVIEISNETGYELTISKEDLFTKIKKIFNNEDIKINHSIFNKKYNIKSNKPLKTISLLNNKDLNNSIISFNPLRIEITKENGLFDEKPINCNYMLYIIKEGKITNINQLTEIHDLIYNIFKKLNHIL